MGEGRRKAKESRVVPHPKLNPAAPLTVTYASGSRRVRVHRAYVYSRPIRLLDAGHFSEFGTWGYQPTLGVPSTPPFTHCPFPSLSYLCLPHSPSLEVGPLPALHCHSLLLPSEGP